MDNIFSKIITNISQVISDLELCHEKHGNIFNESHDQLKATTDKLDEIALRLKIISIMYFDKHKASQKPFIDLTYLEMILCIASH